MTEVTQAPVLLSLPAGPLCSVTTRLPFVQPLMASDGRLVSLSSLGPLVFLAQQCALLCPHARPRHEDSWISRGLWKLPEVTAWRQGAVPCVMLRPCPSGPQAQDSSRKLNPEGKYAWSLSHQKGSFFICFFFFRKEVCQNRTKNIS